MSMATGPIIPSVTALYAADAALRELLLEAEGARNGRTDAQIALVRIIDKARQTLRVIDRQRSKA